MCIRDSWDAAAARHLLSRTGFGGTPDEAARLAALPLDRAVEQLLDEAAAAPAPARPAWVRDQWVNGGRRWSDMSAEEYLIVLRRNSARNAAELADLRAWWLRQMVTSPSPLRERLTQHWHGHFTSASTKVTGFAQAFYQQNATWRKHALGNFRQFLEAVALDPGMMAYLDLEQSNREHPNENFARELLELFTLGVGNYTEKDILETARALSGWVLDAPPGTVKAKRPTAPDRLQFPSITRDGNVPRFAPERHDAGEKTILGKTGRFGLTDVLDLLVAQPACGRHVAGRLIEHFGVADADGSLRERMAAAFRASGTEIRPMLRVLFTAPEFYAVRGDHVKSPVRLLAGACRDLKLDGDITPALAQLTAPLGQELFNPPTVKGWPDGPAWISASTLALRYRLGEALLDGKPLTGTEPLGRPRLTVLARDKAQADATVRRLLQIDEDRREMTGHDGIAVRFDPARILPAGAADDPVRLADVLLDRMVVAPVRPATRSAIVEACRCVSPEERPALAVRLILASPEYQVE
jgi:uncharacterized protein (DUF1800 family)